MSGRPIFSFVIKNVVFKTKYFEEVIAMFKGEGGDFHLVFSDVVHADRDGIKLVDKLISLNPEIRVLLSSGYTD